MKIENELINLIQEVWAEFVSLKQCHDEYSVTIDKKKSLKKVSDIVVNTMPILYFGNLKKYFESKMRIVTVGINPSNQEFITDTKTNVLTYDRFPAMNDIDSHELASATQLTANQIQIYQQALNSYFEKNYYNWFNNKHMDTLLYSFNASYGRMRDGSQHANTAVHIDVATPIATSPTWGGLDAAQSVFEDSGKKTWNKLLGILAPDIIIMSVKNDYIYKYFGKSEEQVNKGAFCKETQKRSNTIMVYQYDTWDKDGNPIKKKCIVVNFAKYSGKIISIGASKIKAFLDLYAQKGYDCILKEYDFD